VVSCRHRSRILCVCVCVWPVAVCRGGRDRRCKGFFRNRNRFYFKNSMEIENRSRHQVRYVVGGGPISEEDVWEPAFFRKEASLQFNLVFCSNRLRNWGDEFGGFASPQLLLEYSLRHRKKGGYSLGGRLYPWRSVFSRLCVLCLCSIHDRPGLSSAPAPLPCLARRALRPPFPRFGIE
jgi:hypothetical protein